MLKNVFIYLFRQPQRPKSLAAISHPVDLIVRRFFESIYYQVQVRRRGLF